MCPTETLEAKHAALVADFRTSLEGQDGHGMPLDDACCTRFLAARDFCLEKAQKMLSEALAWRGGFQGVGVEKALEQGMETIRKENATGKVYVRGTDLLGRPILYMRPREENTYSHDGNILHLVYQMERARSVLQERHGGTGKISIIIDYQGYSLRNAPPMRTSRETLHILQAMYPETLGRAYMVNPPFIFNAFWKIIYPFIDPVTKQKFCFIRGDPSTAANQATLAENFDMDRLESHVGGRNTVPFDSKIYLDSAMGLTFDEALLQGAGGGSGGGDGST